MTTILQVAERAGVSSTTVSHVINKTRHVSDETRQRVLQAMDELDYRPNALARSLRSGKTCTLGLILPDSANPFFAEVGRAIEEAAFRQEYSVILCNTEGDPAKEKLYVDVLMEKQVDGIIFVAAGDRPGSLEPVLEQNLPVVLVDRDLPQVEVDAVLTENQTGGTLATQHLIALGHRRIGCIAGPRHLFPSAQRVAGYRQALRKANLPDDSELVFHGDFHPLTGQQAAARLLQLTNPPTAIFAANDLMAIGVLTAAERRGRRVPDDLALVGFDDIELASYTIPALSTIRQPKDAIGRTAVQLLLARISNRQSEIQRALLPVHLVVRQSSGGAN